jgi:hypothetical protein
MDEVFQKLIDRTRAPLDLRTIKTILGGRHRHHNRTRTGRRPPEMIKSVQTYGYDLTVFKLKWGNAFSSSEAVEQVKHLEDLRQGRARPAYRGGGPQRQGFTLWQDVGKTPRAAGADERHAGALP